MTHRNTPAATRCAALAMRPGPLAVLGLLMGAGAALIACLQPDRRVASAVSGNR